MTVRLDFEKPIVEIEKRIDEIKHVSSEERINMSSEIAQLERKVVRIKEEIYTKLTPWQRVQIARHPERPYTLDYIRMLMTDFVEIKGDRRYGDDKAVVAGFARLDGRKVCVVGQQKGRNTKENIFRNFGCAHPEGYRKALRVMELAGRFGVPVVALIDTPGAYPGVGAEERGQAEAIAVNLRQMFALRVPMIAVIIGEGGSGGALGIGVANRVLMMENAYYSVISPEGCAAILWKEKAMTERAAAALKISAGDLLKLGVIHAVIPEPLGGAHNDPPQAAAALKEALLKHLGELAAMAPDALVKDRYEVFRRFGVVVKEDLPL